MLEQVLAFIHNYFQKEILRGKFKVQDGEMHVTGLQDGQYFRILGSVFNDGVYKYPADDLVDEVFEGEIWAMAVPPSVIAISDEIAVWVDKNRSVIESPYQSESFGGYSYTKANGSGGLGGSASLDWRDVFKSRLNQWRKII